MRDPFPTPSSSFFEAVQPLANYLNLWSLAFHLHEVVAGWICYTIIYTFVSPILSAQFLPTTYSGFSARTKINWNVHVTSFVQSCFITGLALYVIWKDKERSGMDWTGRIWGYTGAMGSVQAFAAGYFVWDLIVSIQHLDILGLGSLAHAISALIITSFGFRPFANYYGISFVLYEVSTPFLNIHWFFDKLGKTGSRIQLYNGIILLITFLGCRVLWGNFQFISMYLDVWKAVHPSRYPIGSLEDQSIFKFQSMDGGPILHDSRSTMDLPRWLIVLYLGGNTMLNFLNVYWFGKMVQALKKRFDAPKVGKSSTVSVREHKE